MSMNGIDVASYQAGLDPAKVPCDFVIVKATQGTGYINPDFSRMAQAAVKAGKLLGIYHYASGGSATKEADYFVKVSADYIGKAILALDWEREQNSQFGKSDVSWCKAFCDRVYEKTGTRCFIYMSKSVCRAHDWSSVAKNNPLWCAQYADMSRTGYQSNPWTDSGSFGAWSAPLIYQYSSGGQLTGWTYRLDLDIAYMSADEWNQYAKGEVKPAEIKYPNKTDTDLGVEILFDVYGADAKRRQALGARYAVAQAEANRLYYSTVQAVNAIKDYLKRHGTGKLI